MQMIAFHYCLLSTVYYLLSTEDVCFFRRLTEIGLEV